MSNDFVSYSLGKCYHMIYPRSQSGKDNAVTKKTFTSDYKSF